ncbi:MAG: hypothetical protein ACK5HS_04525 [Mycoplasmatales bacterium]
MILDLFYKAPSQFTDGDKATGRQAIKLEVDLGEGYEILCFTSSGESFGDNTEDVDESCGGDQVSKIVVSQAYEISFETYISKNKVSESLYNLGLHFNDRQNIPVRLSNSLTNIQKDFMGTIVISDATIEASSLLKLTGTINKYQGEIKETPIEEITTVPATGTLKVGDLTVDTINFTYDYANNDENIINSKIEITKAGSVIDTLSPLTNGTGIIGAFAGLDANTEYVLNLKQNETVLSTITASTIAIRKNK